MEGRAPTALWGKMPRDDCITVMKEVLSIPPSAAASAVASSLLTIGRRVLAASKSSRESSVSWFTDHAKKVWSKITQRFSIRGESARLPWSSLRDSMRSQTPQQRAKAVARFLAVSVKKKWAPRSWREVRDSELRLAAVQTARLSGPREIVDVGMAAIDSACSDPSIENLQRIAEQCKDCRGGRKSVFGILMYAVQAKRDHGEEEMLMGLYQSSPPVIRGSPCTSRETNFADDSYRQSASNSSVSEVSSARQAGRRVLVSDGSKTVDTSTGAEYERGGHLCPIPSSRNVLIVSPDGTCDLVQQSGRGLALQTRFLLKPKASIEWASVEMDEEGCPFVVYGDRDPHRGCPYNTAIDPSKMGTTFCSLGSVFEIPSRVSDADIRKVSRRWTTAGGVLFDLAEQGSSLAVVNTKSSKENEDSMVRTVTCTSRILQGRTVLASYEDEEVACCWGTPLGWVEVLTSGKIRFATLDGPEESNLPQTDLCVTSVCVM